MRKNKILKTNKELLNSAKIINANAPNYVNYPLLINGQKPKLLVSVEEQIACGQSLAELKNENLKLVSSVSGKVLEICERQTVNGEFSLNLKVQNSFAKEETLKKLISPSVKELKSRMLDANIEELLHLQSPTKVAINATDNKYCLGLNSKIFESFFKQVLKGANLIKKALNLGDIYLLVKKQDLDKTQKEVEKLNLKQVVVITKTTKKECDIISVQTALDFYEAVTSGTIKTTQFIAVAGRSIKKPSYYLVKLGTPLSELITLCGNLKHTYKEIEDFKDQAMLAVNDEIQIKQEIKEEKDKEEKQKLKELLSEKKLEAKTKIFAYFKQNQQKYALCLANMVFVTGNKLYSATTDSNEVNYKTQAVLFLSNSEYKNA